MKKLLAADIPLSPPGGFQGLGPLGKSGATAPAQFEKIISTIIGVMTIIIFIWFAFQFIFGAIRIISSGGDKAAVEGARKQITTGIIGLIVTIAAVFIVQLIGSLLGIPNILNPASFIYQLK